MTGSVQSDDAVPADVVTYRYGGSMVYVKLAATFEEAVLLAQREFPDLEHVEKERISFVIGVHARDSTGHQDRVRISAAAWPSVARTFAPLEIIDVVVRSEHADKTKEAPPSYMHPEDIQKSVAGSEPEESSAKGSEDAEELVWELHLRARTERLDTARGRLVGASLEKPHT